MKRLSKITKKIYSLFNDVQPKFSSANTYGYFILFPVVFVVKSYIKIRSRRKAVLVQVSFGGVNLKLDL